MAKVWNLCNPDDDVEDTLIKLFFLINGSTKQFETDITYLQGIYSLYTGDWGENV